MLVFLWILRNYDSKFKNLSDSLACHLQVRLGLGNGSFGSASQFSTEGVLSYALSLGDLNGDGILAGS